MPAASLESMNPLPSLSASRNELTELDEPLAPAELEPDPDIELEPDDPELDGDEDVLPDAELEGAPDVPELDLSPPAIATPETADKAKAKSTALLINFMRGLHAKLKKVNRRESTVA